MLGADSPGKGAETGIKFQGGKAANIGEQVGLAKAPCLISENVSDETHYPILSWTYQKVDEIQRGFRIYAASLLTMHSKLKTFRPAHSPPAHIGALSATYSVNGAWLHR